MIIGGKSISCIHNVNFVFQIELPHLDNQFISYILTTKQIFKLKMTIYNL